MNNPWETEEGQVVWKTESAYYSWLRGALRRLWADYPLRKVWKNSMLRLVTSEEKFNKVFHPSTKKVGQCVFCKEYMAGSKLECDHIVESEGCTSKETAEKFLWHCGGQTSDNFQLACKPCHKAKSLQIKLGLATIEDAFREKEAIQWEKDNKGVKKQRDILSRLGVENAQALKGKEIRSAYVEYLSKV